MVTDSKDAASAAVPNVLAALALLRFAFGAAALSRPFFEALFRPAAVLAFAVLALTLVVFLPSLELLTLLAPLALGVPFAFAMPVLLV
jgi:hypothetical protein